MAPINPHDLCKAFEPFLTPDGGITDCTVTRLSALMQKFSKKLVSKCIYMNTLLQTSQEVLDTFLEKHGGWDILNGWLKSGKEQDDEDFIIELLMLFQVCPVTIDRLKSNDTPKVIKSLTKPGNNHTIVEMANALVKSWTAVISKTSVTKSKKRSKAEGDENSSDENKRPKVDLPASNGAINGSANGSPPLVVKKEKVDSSDDSNSCDPIELEKAERKPTAIVKPGKSNLDKLLLPSSEKKKTSSSPSSDLRLNKKDALAESTTKSDSVQPVNETSPTTKTTNPVTPPVTPTLIESNLFAQELEPVVQNRKRKVVRQNKVDEDHDGVSNERRPSTSSSNSNDATLSTPQNCKIPRTNSVSLPNGTCPITPGPSKSYPRGCLSAKSSSIKKKVKWMPDEFITAVKLFEVEDNERVNMYKVNSMAQMSAVDHKNEGDVFKRRNPAEQQQPPPNGIKLAPWVVLQVDLPDNEFVPGRNSGERDIQALRQQSVTAVFMSKKEGPESPVEPDRVEILAINARMPPKVIPTDNPSGGYVDYSHMPIPSPRNNPMYSQHHHHHHHQHHHPHYNPQAGSQWQSFRVR